MGESGVEEYVEEEWRVTRRRCKRLEGEVRETDT